ncbi:MAG: hypothetical protein WDZ94_05410 [Patescibacteria group bacterium]
MNTASPQPNPQLSNELFTRTIPHQNGNPITEPLPLFASTSLDSISTYGYHYQSESKASRPTGGIIVKKD